MKRFRYILVILFISYVVWFIYSFDHPYIAPGWLNITCGFILAPSLIVILYIVYLSGKLSSFQLKKYRDRCIRCGFSKRKTNFYAYILPGILGIIICMSVYLIPVIPTRLYADHDFKKEVKVINVLCYGYSSFSKNPSTEIRYFDKETNETHTLWYPVNLCKLAAPIHELDGKTIKLVGRTWLLGTYIDNFHYPTQK